jgi:pilus assembly protein CpaB
VRFALNKNWLVISAALALGGLAAFGTQRYIRSHIDEIDLRERMRKTVKQVVAKQDLGKGAVLTPDTVAVREIPAEWAHSNALTPDQFDRAEGAALAYPVRQGEPVLWSQLAGQRAPSFSARLAPGRRAVTVAVDEISSLSGMVEPGDRIDLVVSTRMGERPSTLTLLQSVLVLAVGARADQRAGAEAGERSFTTMTLDVSPLQAKRIIAARESGRLTALLRAPADQASTPGQGDDAAAAFDAAAAAAPLALSSVPVIYGGSPIHGSPLTGLAARRVPAEPDEPAIRAAGEGMP